MIKTKALFKSNKYILIAIPCILASAFLYLSGKNVKLLLNSQVDHAPIEYVLAVIWSMATVAMAVRAFKAIRTDEQP